METMIPFCFLIQLGFNLQLGAPASVETVLWLKQCEFAVFAASALYDPETYANMISMCMVFGSAELRI